MSWASIQGDASIPQIVSGNLVNNAGTLQRLVESTVRAIDQEAWVPVGQNDFYSLFTRYDTSTDTGYRLNYDPSTNVFTISKATGVGAFTTLFTSALARPLYAPPPAFVAPTGRTVTNVLTTYGNDDASVRAAVADAIANNKDLYFPASTYVITGTVTLNGIRAWGDGDTTVISTLDRQNSAMILTGTAPFIGNMKITCPNYTGSRQSNNEATGVYINGATGAWMVDHVTVDGTAAVGIFNFGGAGTSGAHAKIQYCRVMNTLADGIHNTNVAAFVDVIGNVVGGVSTPVGDDMIACVSYQSNGAQSHDILVRDNVCLGQTFGRGITVVGGNTVTIERNYIQHSYGASIYLASEPAFTTYGVSGVIVRNNYMRFPAEGGIHNDSILIWGGITGQQVTTVSGSNNNTDPTFPNVDYTGDQASNTVTGSVGLTLPAPVIGTADVLTLRNIGNRLNGWLNEIQVAYVDDSTYNRTGKIGLGLGPNGAWVPSFGGGDATAAATLTVSKTGSGTQKSDTDANSTTTEATTLVARPNATDADGTPTEIAAISETTQDSNSTVTEAVALKEVQADTNGTVTETPVISETTSDANGTVTEAASLVESASTSDSNSGSDNAVAKIAETTADANGTVTESAATAISFISSDSDGAITEAATITVPVSSSDANSTTTEVAIEVAQISTPDSGSSSEVAALKEVQPDANGTTTEQTAIAVPTADSNGTVTESAAPTITASSSDSGTDSEISALTVQIPATDQNGTTTESQSVQQFFGGTGQDSGTATEIALQKAVTPDSNGSVTETASPAFSAQPPADGGSTAESASAGITVAPAAQGGTATETASVRVFVSDTELGSSTDQAVMVFLAIAAEAGISLDAAQVTVTEISSDQGTDSESASVVLTSLQLSSSDGGSAGETEGNRAAITSTELAIMTEIASVIQSGLLVGPNAKHELTSAGLEKPVLLSADITPADLMGVT